MKRIEKIVASLILFFLLLCFPCQAEEKKEIEVALSKHKVEIGQKLELRISVSQKRIIAYELEIYWDKEKLSYLSGGEKEKVEGNKIHCLWYDEAGKKEGKTGEVAHFSFDTKQAGSVNFVVTGKVYEEEGKEIEVFGQTQGFIEESLPKAKEESIEKEKRANLETLAIQDVMLYPAFEENVTSYRAEIGKDVSQIQLLAIPKEENASVKVQGTMDLQEGENIVKIVVRTQDGAFQKEYEIKVHKRNQEEEKKAEEEEAQRQEKLEKAYRTQKLIATEENPSKSEEKIQEGGQTTKAEEKTWGRSGLGVLLAGILLGILWYGIDRKRKEKGKRGK